MELPEWVSNENPANGHRRLAAVIPERGVRAEFHRTGIVVVPCDRCPAPACIGAVEEFPERGQALALETRASHLTGQSSWSGFVERGVEPQPGDEGNGLGHRLAEVEQVECGAAAVSHHDDGTVWKPTPELEYHLARPVGDPLVSPSHLPVVAFGRSQSRQYRQCPCPMRPGYGGQPHQAYPAQARGLDQMAVAGARSVSVDALCPDATAPPPLNCFVYPEYQWTVPLGKMLNQKRQQNSA